VNPGIVKAIARKEFYHLVRDFRSLYLAFVIPLLLILMFGYALSLHAVGARHVVNHHVELRREDQHTDAGAADVGRPLLHPQPFHPDTPRVE